MTWQQLKNYIETLSPEELSQIIYLDDWYNSRIRTISNSYKIDCDLCEGFHGVKSSLDESDEKFKDFWNRSYLKIKSGTPIITLD